MCQNLLNHILKQKKAYSKNGLIFKRNPDTNKLELVTLDQILKK